MMAVLRGILFLLKVIGILLLVVLGLLLLVILLALLAPVRYRGKVQKKEEPEDLFLADAKVTWLNPFFRVRILFSEKKLRYTVRILGICLLNSEKPKKEKQKKEKQKKEKTKKKQKSDKGKKERKAGKSSDKPTEETITVSSEESKNTEASEQSVELPKHETQVRDVADGEESLEDSASETKKSFFEKIKALFEKIKTFIEKMRAIPGKIKEKVVRIRSQIELLWKKKEALFGFLQEEVHILAIGKAMNTLKRMLGHILPGKIKGSVEFGTGDPESTGKALAGLGILYAAYGKGFTIVPDFFEKRLVADVTFRGRVRLGTLLIMVLRLITDKQVRAFYKDLKKVIEVLKQKAE